MSPSVEPLAPTRPERMSGRVRRAPYPLRDVPDPSDFVEHATVDGRRAFVARRVVREVEQLERRHRPDETAGLLFGRFFTDGEHDCVIVTDLVTPEPGEVVGTSSTVTITARGAEQMPVRARLRTPLADPVGWFHTHPRFEAFFSRTDEAEQQAWREPGSVGLVLSGLPAAARPYCVFVGPEAAPAEPVAPSKRLGRAEYSGPLRLPAAIPEAAPPPRVQRPLSRPTPRRSVWIGVGAVAAAAACLALVAISLLALREARAARRDAEAARRDAGAALVRVAGTRPRLVPLPTGQRGPRSRARVPTAYRGPR